MKAGFGKVVLGGLIGTVAITMMMYWVMSHEELGFTPAIRQRT